MTTILSNLGFPFAGMLLTTVGHFRNLTKIFANFNSVLHRNRNKLEFVWSCHFKDRKQFCEPALFQSLPLCWSLHFHLLCAATTPKMAATVKYFLHVGNILEHTSDDWSCFFSLICSCRHFSRFLWWMTILRRIIAYSTRDRNTRSMQANNHT